MHPVAKSTNLPEVHYPWLCWDEWVALPVRIRDLPSTAQLVRPVLPPVDCARSCRPTTAWTSISFCCHTLRLSKQCCAGATWGTRPLLMPLLFLQVISVVGVGNAVLFSSTTRVFDSKLRLKRGLQKLSLWSLDESPAAPVSSIAVKDSGVSDEYFRLLKLKERYCMCAVPVCRACACVRAISHKPPDPCFPYNTLPALPLASLRLSARYDHGELPHCSILDRLTFRQLESLRLGLTHELTLVPESDLSGVEGPSVSAAGQAGASDDGVDAAAGVPWEVYIELPYFDFPVVFDDQVYDNADVTPVPLLASGPAVPKKLDMVRPDLMRRWCSCRRKLLAPLSIRQHAPARLRSTVFISLRRSVCFLVFNRFLFNVACHLLPSTAPPAFRTLPPTGVSGCM
jgi:hypothetical protein